MQKRSPRCTQKRLLQCNKEISDAKREIAATLKKTWHKRANALMYHKACTSPQYNAAKLSAAMQTKSTMTLKERSPRCQKIEHCNTNKSMKECVYNQVAIAMWCKLEPYRNQLTSTVPIGTFSTDWLHPNNAGFLKKWLQESWLSTWHTNLMYIKNKCNHSCWHGQCRNFLK